MSLSNPIETETLLVCPLCASEAVVLWCEGRFGSIWRRIRLTLSA